MTDLSPTAQAVLAAAQKVAAAAIRAAADQIVPFPGRYPMNNYMEGIRDTKQDLRKQLCTIADELEAL
jgi:hypothetical protein